MLFRFLVLFFTVASIVLLVWSLVGSYKNASYLTNNYLISLQLSNLNLSALFQDGINANSKRDFIEQGRVALSFPEVEPARVTESPVPTNTEINEKRAVDYTSLVNGVGSDATAAIASLTSKYGVGVSDLASVTSTPNLNSLASNVASYASAASVPDSIASLAAEVTGDLSSILENIVSSANASDLGFSDMYTISFYGYCKGDLESETKEISELGKLGKEFKNDNVNYTYCSKPKVVYKFDPLALLKHEATEMVKDYADGISTLTGGLSDKFAAELLAAVSSLTYEDMGLPGNLQTYLNVLHKCTVAGYSLILAGACLAFISFVFQLVGLFCSPENSCLSCCNSILMTLVALVVIAGSGLTTGAYMYVRRVINNSLDEYNVKSYLSIQFYAFSWSAAVAAILFVVLSIIGYCCGCFHPNHGRRYSRRYREPELVYDHKA